MRPVYEVIYEKRLLFIPVILICIAVLSSCSAAPKKSVLHAIIIPKFEVGEMSGDFPGEAQLFYERYCPDCAEIEIPHMPPTGHFYMNEETGVGILVTGSGKTAAGLSLMAVLSSDLFMDVDMPETLWMEDTNINQKFARNNTETLDIFEPAMHNLFDAASIVIDAILEEKL